MRFLSIHLLLLLPAAVLGYQIPRREAFLQAVGGASAVLCLAPTQPANAVLRSAGCYQGEGEACAELAGENDLIKSLQEKSSANRERNEKEARDAYYMKNYPDFFATVGKVMVKKPDGGFILVSDAELEQLKKSNKLTYEVPRTMGGRTVDTTQKPIWLLKE